MLIARMPVSLALRAVGALVLAASIGCNAGQEIPDPPLPTDGETVGTDVLRFAGRVPKNLLFLSIDTIRKDHLSPHGSLGLTPFLDRIASEGVVMNDHTTCSNWTFAGTTCTIAGRTHVDRGHIPRLNGGKELRPPVPEGTPFLSTWLGQAGYFSAIISANDWLSDNWGNVQGYDYYSRPGGNAYAVHQKGTEAVRDAVARGEADRWFLHLHFMEPHAAYDPPDHNLVGIDELPPWPYGDLTVRDTHYDARDDRKLDEKDRELLEQHLRLLYQGEIRTIDERLEDIWRDLERDGYLNDTLVVIWNDHGEQFWEHGHQTHAYSLFGEENDGFLIFWAPNIEAGTYDGPTAAIDVVPTILDLFGIEMPEEVTGLPIGTAPAGRPRHTASLARRGGINGVVVDGWKMQFLWRNGTVVVHDRNTDPEETVDLFDPEDPQTLALWSHLRPQAEAMAELVVGGTPQPTFPSTLPSK